MPLPLPSLTYNYHKLQIRNQKGNKMDTSSKVNPRSYEDFKPLSEWKREEEADTLVISLPGFKRDQLKINLDNLGNLRVSGERPLAGERWSRFREDFRIPQKTRTGDIRAKFENGILSVLLPKFTAESQPREEQEPESGKKTAMEPKTSPLSSGKQNGSAMAQSNGKSKETTEPVDAAKASPTFQEKEKDQIHKPGDEKQPASDASDKDAELPSSRKRKTAAEDETLDDGGSAMEPKAGGLRMRFKNPRQLMLNVGVAAVILVGLAFYVSYKLRKSIEAHSN